MTLFFRWVDRGASWRTDPDSVRHGERHMDSVHQKKNGGMDEGEFVVVDMIKFVGQKPGDQNYHHPAPEWANMVGRAAGGRALPPGICNRGDDRRVRVAGGPSRACHLCAVEVSGPAWLLDGSARSRVSKRSAAPHQVGEVPVPFSLRHFCPGVAIDCPRDMGTKRSWLI